MSVGFVTMCRVSGNCGRVDILFVKSVVTSGWSEMEHVSCVDWRPDILECMKTNLMRNLIFLLILICHYIMSNKVEVPQEYLCPITYVMMTDPVFDCNGHTYERSAIEEWFGKSWMSPITHSRVTNKNLTPNILLRGQISDFKEANKDKEFDLPEDVSSGVEAKAVYTPPSIEFNGYKTSDGLDVGNDR